MAAFLSLLRGESAMSEQADVDVPTRPYDPESDREALWELKRGFELGIGEGTGDDEKAAVYEGKLTQKYRERWLAWVDRCVDEDPECVVVAEDAGSTATIDGVTAGSAAERSDELVGYAFVLPESLSFVWDAAVLNEIFVREAHRGAGLADDLMDAAIATARDQDLPLDRLVLDVDRENDRARDFYDRHGFDHWGEMVARPL
jgi:ribosomal protein S18 acetylase RimI-like enzyme